MRHGLSYPNFLSDVIYLVSAQCDERQIKWLQNRIPTNQVSLSSTFSPRKGRELLCIDASKSFGEGRVWSWFCKARNRMGDRKMMPFPYLLLNRATTSQIFVHEDLIQSIRFSFFLVFFVAASWRQWWRFAWVVPLCLLHAPPSYVWVCI